jgi:hypothetical protein
VILIVAAPLPESARAGVPDVDPGAPIQGTRLDEPLPLERSRRGTLWIFDADFEDLAGDNAGWTTSDRSGRPPSANYWHKDTIRINGFEYLGDSTWWCGRVDTTGCWKQPRGYGNCWTCYLERELPLSDWSEPGDDVVLEWDQRYAMETAYDYGHVDVSTDGGSTWTTIDSYTNPNFIGAGIPQDWDSPSSGHPVHSLDWCAGSDVALRFRFESDWFYSAEDVYVNSHGSVEDGAWQIDNVTFRVNDAVVWLDDCEAPGDNGWVHDAFPGEGQTGIAFRRVYEEFEDPVTHEHHEGWMMAAYDTITGTTVDGQHSMLRSPLVDVGGAPQVVAEWTGWVDIPEGSNDRARIGRRLMTDPACAEGNGSDYFWSYDKYNSTGSHWVTGRRDCDRPDGHDWFDITLDIICSPSGVHGLCFVLDRLRIGVPVETAVPEGGPPGARVELAGPSPFSTSTTIRFVIPATGHVAIRIHDLAGRLVRTLVDAEQGFGEHEVIWDGRTDSGARAASGVYFLRMESGGFRSVDKLVLLR